MSLLQDLYNESDVDESEDDQDYVPEDESEEDDHQIEEQESDIEEDKKTHRKSSKKRKLSITKEDKEDESTKKTRIDAIWKEMNTQASGDKEEEKTSGGDSSPKGEAKEQLIDQVKEEEEVPKTSRQKPAMRRPKSNLSSLVSKYNIKEPKMNTLEKSKLDWQGYVDREGIRDELKYKNKDGYMEKVAFLQRVDDRRLSQLKEGQKKERKDQ